jgi:hypothetical protein
MRQRVSDYKADLLTDLADPAYAALYVSTPGLDGTAFNFL